MNFKTIIPLILVLGMNPAQADTDRIGAPIVGYVETSPGICQVDYYNTITKDLYQLNESCDNDNLS